VGGGGDGVVEGRGKEGDQATAGIAAVCQSHGFDRGGSDGHGGRGVPDPGRPSRRSNGESISSRLSFLLAIEPRGGGEGSLGPGGPRVANCRRRALCSLTRICGRANFAFFLSQELGHGGGTSPRDDRRGARGGFFPHRAKIHGHARLCSLLPPLPR